LVLNQCVKPLIKKHIMDGTNLAKYLPSSINYQMLAQRNYKKIVFRYKIKLQRRRNGKKRNF